MSNPLSFDTLASRAKIAVIVPATNTVVQPEMEAMRPAGVTNHVSRMLLPPRPYDDMQAYQQALKTEKGQLEEALALVLPCEPHAVAHGHSIHSFRGDLQRAQAEDISAKAAQPLPRQFQANCEQQENNAQLGQLGQLPGVFYG